MTMRIRYPVLFLTLLFIFMSVPMPVRANGQMLLETQKKVQIYEEQDTGSAVVAVLEKGTPLICTESEEEGWYRITYQDIEGYARADALDAYVESEQLDEEFDSVAEDNELRMEDLEALAKQEKSKRLWGGIMIGLIVVMVAGMFASGLYAVKNNRKNKGATSEHEGEG